MCGQRVAALVSLFALAVAGCSSPKTEIGFVASSPPVAMILRELVGDRWPVVSLLTPGQSPHTYAPRPSDAARSEAALAVFHVSENLDGWAADLPARKRVALISLVPDAFRLEAKDDHDHGHDHDHGDTDPHFWGDPLAVRAMLGPLADALTEADPEGEAQYRAEAVRFGAELEALDAELRRSLEPVQGAAAILFHPSWGYFLARYGIRTAGTVEPFAGKEATPKFLAELTALAQRESVRAIFTEPQLARRPAEVVAEAAGVPCYELDPLGGVAGRETYAELLRYNARVLLEALR
jgi:zinc transport system substrate-binding protein